MAKARDVFTLPLFGRQPHLADYALAMPEAVAADLLGSNSVECASDVDAAITGIAPERLSELRNHAELILHGARVDIEELQNIATKRKIPFLGSDGEHAIVLRLIRAIGPDEARAELEAALAPSAQDSRGTFAHYPAPPFDFTNLDAMRCGATLEHELERRISTAQEPRRVRVRAEVFGGRLIVNIHYERPDTDGSKIGNDKRVSTVPFARGAGSTYVVVLAESTRSRVMLRSPGSSLQEHILSAVGAAVWDDTGAVLRQPSSQYNLSVFKDPSFALSVAPAEALEIADVQLVEIDVRAATANKIKIRAFGSDSDALSDYHAIAQNASALIKGSVVESVIIRFRSAQDRRRRPRVRITPTTLTLDEQNWTMVEHHLLHWNIIRG